MARFKGSLYPYMLLALGRYGLNIYKYRVSEELDEFLKVAIFNYVPVKPSYEGQVIITVGSSTLQLNKNTV